LKNNMKFFSSIHKHIKKGDTIFILGNGPSLKEQLETQCDFIASFPCVCANNFVSTDFYEKIKPSVYVLVDPSYFVCDWSKDSCSHVVKEIDMNWKNLFERTKWNMKLVVPARFKSCARFKQLKENTYISILFYNDLDSNVYLNKKSMFKLFNRNKLSVPAQTVINTAVYLAVFWRYKNIVLLGADTSLHEDISIDQKTNTMYSKNKHFYGSEKQVVYKDTIQTISFKLHEYLYAISRMFELYMLLREYADYNSVSVFNASEKSWIDAFERKTLEELKSILGFNHGSVL
jgi:hypothetical protein